MTESKPESEPPKKPPPPKPKIPKDPAYEERSSNWAEENARRLLRQRGDDGESDE